MNYPDLARDLDVVLCQSCDLLTDRKHVDGTADTDGIVHWKDRRLNRLGLYRFLKLVRATRLAPSDPHWAYVYEMNQFAQRKGLTLGIRFSRRYSAADRAWLLWYADNHPGTIPAHARRWANRKD